MKKNKSKSSFSVTRLLLILTTILLTFSIFCTPVFAEDEIYDCPACSDEHNISDLPNGLAKTAFRWATTIFDTKSLGTSVSASLKLRSYGDIWDTAESIYDAVCVVGSSLAVIYYLIALLDKAQSEQFSLEQFLKQTIKFTITLIILKNGLALLKYLLIFSDKLFDEIWLKTSGTSSDKICEIYTRASECDSWFLGGTVDAFGLLMELVIPYICMFAAKLLIMINSYSRALEFFVRVAFAPIGLASLASGENTHQSLRYIKKLLAVGIQGAMIFAIVLCYASLMGSVKSSTFLSAMGAQAIYIVVAFAVIGLMSKTQSWANDLLNV